MDSKELTLQRIKELAGFIRDNHYLRNHVIITPRRFNELYAKLKDERRTLNDLLAWGHSKAIEGLLESVRKDNEKIRIVIDEFDRVRTEQHLQSVLNMDNVEVIQYPKAEENMAVAAASIIARDLREDYIDILCKRLQKNLRNMTVESALKDADSIEYAKLSYLSKLAKPKV
jgi:ribonuclease HIII